MSMVDTGPISAAAVSTDPTLATLVPRGAAEQLQLVPIELVGDVLTVAMVEPGDVFVQDELARLTHKRIKPVPIAPPELRILIGRLYANIGSDPEERYEDDPVRANTVVLGSTSTMSADAPTVLLLNE